MEYAVKIKNEMFGYERNQVILIEAKNKDDAIKAAQDIDCFADGSIENAD